MPQTSRTAASKIIRNPALGSKQNINPSRARGPKQNSKSSKALKSILTIKVIELSSNVLGRYKECQEFLTRFWSWVGIRLSLEADAIKLINFYFCEAYLSIVSLEIQHE